jgi:hypothetical protein
VENIPLPDNHRCTDIRVHTANIPSGANIAKVFVVGQGTSGGILREVTLGGEMGEESAEGAVVGVHERGRESFLDGS